MKSFPLNNECGENDKLKELSGRLVHCLLGIGGAFGFVITSALCETSVQVRAYFCYVPWERETVRMDDEDWRRAFSSVIYNAAAAAAAAAAIRQDPSDRFVLSCAGVGVHRFVRKSAPEAGICHGVTENAFRFSFKEQGTRLYRYVAAGTLVLSSWNCSSSCHRAWSVFRLVLLSYG
jgi:hypothetical protein